MAVHTNIAVIAAMRLNMWDGNSVYPAPLGASPPHPQPSAFHLQCQVLCIAKLAAPPPPCETSAPLRASLIRIAAALFLLIFLSYVAVGLVPSEMIGGVDRVRIISETLSESDTKLGPSVAPSFNLIVVLAIAEWGLTRAGIKPGLATPRLTCDAQIVANLTSEQRRL